MDAPLSQTIQIQLDSSGNGQIGIGPIGAREIWMPQNVHVSITTAVSEAQCDIFVGDLPQQSNYRDTTFSGSSGDSSDRVNADTVKNPAKVWAVWTGGDPKAIATLVVTGRKTV